MSYAHLSVNERYVISHLHMAGFSSRAIGRCLHRHHSTIDREIKRVITACPHTPYWYHIAQKLAQRRQNTARHFRKLSNNTLVRYVVARLTKQWSPEEIVGRLLLDYPEDTRMRISHETIYRWVYLAAEGGNQLFRNLRRGHKKRHRQKRYGQGQRFMHRKTIADRPVIVDERARLGDWEGDTVEGKKRSGLIVTLVERTSRYLLAAKIKNKESSALAQQAIRLFSRMPHGCRKTLTVDNGTEFSAFQQIEDKSSLAVYFAHPYSPWQRGTNENTNGLLRQYFPKGSDFEEVNADCLAEAVKRLNNRPRKCLNYQTPHEVFWKNARGALTT